MLLKSPSAITIDKSRLDKLIRVSWFTPVFALSVFLIAALILIFYNRMNEAPGMRRTLAVTIMPVTVAAAGLFAPLLYRLMTFKASQTKNKLIKLVGLGLTVVLMSYVTGWVYFQWIIQVPKAARPVYQFVSQELIAISMPFWGVLALMALMRKTGMDGGEKQGESDTNLAADPLAIQGTHGNKTYFLTPAAIIWAQAEGNYTRLHTDDRFYIRHGSLTELEQIGAGSFLRIHRSHLVNLSWIESIASLSHGDLTVFLKSGQALKCSRHYAEKLRAALERV